MKRLGFLSLLLIVITCARAEAVRQTMRPAEFWARPELTQRIDISRFDAGLMSAALFHETNRVRAQHGLPPFRYEPQLDLAASSQSSIGALMETVSHDNPLPDLATIKDRVLKTGLRFKIVAENIAATTILEGPTGLRTVHAKRIAGRQVLLDPKTGAELLPRTYAAMAVAVIAQLMNSPAHRENIVSRELLCLGTSATPRKNADGMDSLYCVQVFFTPPTEPQATQKKSERPRGSILKESDMSPATDRLPRN